MRPFPTADQAREYLRALVKRQATSLAYLSRAMGRPDRYLDRYLREGRPEWLEQADREYLARWFNVDTFELGDRDKTKPD